MEEDKAEDEKSDKKGFVYDQSKSFFRNLCEMIIDLKSKENFDQMRKEFQKQKGKVNVPENVLKEGYLDSIFSVKSERLREMHIKKKKEEPIEYKPHVQTAKSTIYKLLAKPDYDEDEENLQLNNRIQMVQHMLDESPAIDKFKEN